MATSVSEAIERLKIIIEAKTFTGLKFENITLIGRYVKDKNGFPVLLDEKDNNKQIGLFNALPIAENSLIEVYGAIGFAYNKGFYPKFNIAKYQIIQTTSQEEQSLIDTLNQKLKQFNPRLLSTTIRELEGKIKCLLIHGKNAQTQHDFFNGLNQDFPAYKDFIQIETIEIYLNDDALANVISENAQNYDVIFLVRGGGDEKDLRNVGGIKSAIAILDANKPFYIAIGHSQDKNLSELEKVCDYAYHTPSILGSQFGMALKEYHEKKDLEKQNMNLSKELKEYQMFKVQKDVIIKEKEQLEKEKSKLENEVTMLRNRPPEIRVETRVEKEPINKMLVGVIVLLLAVIVLLIFLKV